MELPWEPGKSGVDDEDLPTRTGGVTRTGTGSDGARVPDEPPLESGTEISGYRVIELIAEGGMGRVYLAEHSKLGRRVALKVLRRRYGEERETIRRFFEEARAVNRIRHEHIIEVHDFLEPEDESPCYVMELLEGRTLAQLLKQQGPLPVESALRVGAQVASALAAAHAEGIIHRDLKPDNIYLIERSGQTDYVKLLDFGVAKLESSTDDERVMGTPAYMAPEQLEGRLVDARADVYAFGVVLYQLLSGVRPFTGRSAGELLLKHATEPPTPLRETDGPGATAPRELDGLVMRCLSKERDRRPASMTEVEQSLHSLLSPKSEPRVRSALLAALAAVSVIGLAYVVGASTSSSDVTTQPAPPATPPTPAAPSVPTEVELRFASTPPGAEVRRLGSDEVLGVTPFSTKVARASESVVFLFALEGRGSSSTSVSLASDGEVNVTFADRPAPPPVRATNPTPPSKPPVATRATDPPSADKPKPKPKPSPKPEDGRAVIMDPFSGN
jgi:serine/threonine-protein kinase